MSEMDKLRKLAQEHKDLKVLVRKQAKLIKMLQEQLTKVRDFVNQTGAWWL